MTRDKIAVIAIFVSVAFAAVVTWAVGSGSVERAGLPAIYWCVIAAFAINWIAFIPSMLAQTERYFDLTGAITYISVTVLALVLGDSGETSSLIMGLLIFIWAGRLGSFLFRRITRDGQDRRFNRIRANPIRLFETWTLQGLWVSLTAMAAWTAITSVNGAPFGILTIVGVAVWVAGFAIEVKADSEKTAFAEEPANDGQFISTGIWSWSRHPNYFGEITLWVGMALIALPAFGGREFVALISPVFVFVLLTRISGVPALERRGQKRWGDDPDYKRYVADVPVLIPKPPQS